MKPEKYPSEVNCTKLLNAPSDEDEISEEIEYEQPAPNEDVVEERKQKFLLTDVQDNEFAKIQEFTNEPSTRYFGMPKFKLKSKLEFFETSVTHRIKLQFNDRNKEIAGFAEVITCLPLECLLPDNWIRFFQTLYCITERLHFSDTLFIKHISYHQDHGDEIFSEVAREMFLREVRVRNIVALEMPQMEFLKKNHYPDFTPLAKVSKVYYPKVYSVTHWNVPKVHISLRDTYIDKMIYRKAVTEDNDDLVKIVDRDYPEVRQALGDYYVAEEILEGHKREVQTSTILCVEIENVTSGFMWFNTNLDIEYLIRNYEVDPFDFLIKVNPQAPQSQLILNAYSNESRKNSSVFAHEYIKHLIHQQQKRHRCSSKNKDLSPLTDDGEVTQRSLRHRFKRLGKGLNYLELATKNILDVSNYAVSIEKKIIVNYNITEEVDNIDTNSNAFAIQLFGLGKHVDIREGFKVLLSAFNLYKNRDYCLLSIPSSMHISKSTEALIRHFIPVPLRNGSSAVDRLFVTHRSAVHGDIKVQKLQLEDMNAVESCLITVTADITTMSNMSLAQLEIVREMMNDVLHNPDSNLTFLTIRIGNSLKPEVPWAIVGFVVLRSFTNTYFLKKHFRLLPAEDIYTARCELVSLVLHPLYHCMSDELFREIARYLNVWNFYYFIPIKSSKRPLKNDMVNYMQPLEPQPIKKAWFIGPKKVYLNDSDKKTKIGSLDILSDYFAVFQRSLLPSKIFDCPLRIVIYGFSEACKAFLRCLIFHWKSYALRHIQTFTCVTRLDVSVIVPPGVVDCEFTMDFRCETCEDSKYCWTSLENGNAFIRDATHRLDMRIWVQFIYGYIKSVDKYV